MSYSVQEHLKPKALVGISDAQVEQHWALYKAYVTNTNGLLEDLGKAEVGSRAWSELARRMAFEVDGMVLHEYYFGNLAPGATLSPQSRLASSIVEGWSTPEAWREEFAAMAAMRGNGWVILYRDPATDRLFNWWVGDHELSHPAGFHPILVLDVWEHAFMVDHAATERAKYVQAFWDNVHWQVVEQRFKESADGRTPARF